MAMNYDTCVCETPVAQKAKANAKATAAKRQLAGSTASTHSFKCHFKLK